LDTFTTIIAGDHLHSLHELPQQLTPSQSFQQYHQLNTIAQSPIHGMHDPTAALIGGYGRREGGGAHNFSHWKFSNE
jgi:hypothetical protein